MAAVCVDATQAARNAQTAAFREHSDNVDMLCAEGLSLSPRNSYQGARELPRAPARGRAVAAPLLLRS